MRPPLQRRATRRDYGVTGTTMCGRGKPPSEGKGLETTVCKGRPACRASRLDGCLGHLLVRGRAKGIRLPRTPRSDGREEGGGGSCTAIPSQGTPDKIAGAPTCIGLDNTPQGVTGFVVGTTSTGGGARTRHAGSASGAPSAPGCGQPRTTRPQKTHQDRAARATARDTPLRWGGRVGCERPA